MKYVSLFTGIGGFEQAIHKLYPDAECLAYSEIEPYAIKIYQRYYPDHKNLGDVTKITAKKIKDLGHIDLIVGGFPCTNLSSMANFNGDNKGLQGPKSGLFFNLVTVLQHVYKYNPKVKFMIENNYSMKKAEKKIITDTLKENFEGVYCNMINNASFGVQTRKRLIWTNFKINPPGDDHPCSQTWDDVLDDKKVSEKYALSDSMVECLNKLLSYKNCKGHTKIAVPSGSKKNGRYNFQNFETTTEKSRWDICGKSDTMDTQLYTYPLGKSRPIMSGSGGSNNIVLDRRYKNGFLVRRFTPEEIERLFGFPSGYTEGFSDTKRRTLLGNSIPVMIVDFILNQSNLHL
jgi:DNA-cytosine methyltransferase